MPLTYFDRLLIARIYRSEHSVLGTMHRWSLELCVVPSVEASDLEAGGFITIHDGEVSLTEKGRSLGEALVAEATG